MNCELCIWMPVGLTQGVVCQGRWKSCVRETGFWNAMSEYSKQCFCRVQKCNHEAAQNAEKSWFMALKDSIQWMSPGHTENTQHQLKILQQPSSELGPWTPAERTPPVFFNWQKPPSVGIVMVWFGGTLPLASTPIWGHHREVTQLGGAPGHGCPPAVMPSMGFSSRSSSWIQGLSLFNL